MKKISIIAMAVLIAHAAPAAAAGYIELGWGDCAPLGPSTATKTQLCTTNTALPLILVGSFEPPDSLHKFNGHEGVLDLQTNEATLSQWWHMEVGGCRGASITSSFDFTSGPFTCTDVWGGQASGGLSYTLTAANRARIKTVCAVADAFQADIAPGFEYYVFKVTINNAKSVGTGSCLGCLVGACIVFNSIKLTQPAGFGDRTLTTGAQQAVSYRGGITGDCYVPVLTRSWGQIKSLYR